jgi:DNA-directed RNA polymerase specialized sigma subunit
MSEDNKEEEVFYAKFSFDVDGTLRDHFGDVHKNPEKEKVREYAKKLIKAGFRVLIITRRFGPDKAQFAMKGDEHTEVYDIADEIGVKREDIHFTDREWKYKKLIDLGVNFHLDDDTNEISILHLVNYGREKKCMPICITKDANDSKEEWYKVIDKIIENPNKFI